MTNLRTGKDYVVPRRTDAKRVAVWDEVVDKCRAEADTLMQAGREEHAKLILLQLDGGECWQCHKPWNLVTVDNAFVTGIYYLPSCDCYPRCPMCRKWLYEDREAGVMDDWRCTGCGWRMYVKGKDDKMYRRWGFAFEERLLRMSKKPAW